MKIEEAIKLLNVNSFDNKLTELYVDSNRIPQEKERYLKAIDSYRAYFGEGEIEIFSAPGRSEIGGNHTDHQHGEVLAASINNDAIAVVKKLEEPFVKVMSDGYSNLITIRLDDLEKKIEEEGSTNALIRGVLAKMKMNGHLIGGFQAYVTSEVLIGAGLSSSAAFETLIGTILSYMYNDGEVTPIEIAKIGQYAENIYFGKPCGLMDQMACSVGSLVHIDFADPENPIVEQVDFDMNAYGYSLCITDTKTLIARMRGNLYELDLVLRNNITTADCPLGLFHPHAEYHHIKKENIGLIEVMGLAVLPARLKKEMAELEQAILNHEDLRQNETMAAHADWAEEWLSKYEITDSNIHSIVQKEIGIVFTKVLEDAGVYKRTEEGKAAFKRFVKSL